MNKLFIIRNQHNHYLGKRGEWVDGSRPTALFRSAHRDEVVNELFEVNVRDWSLRGVIIECDSHSDGLPIVEVLNPIAEPEPEPETQPQNADA